MNLFQRIFNTRQAVPASQPGPTNPPPSLPAPTSPIAPTSMSLVFTPSGESPAVETPPVPQGSKELSGLRARAAELAAEWGIKLPVFIGDPRSTAPPQRVFAAEINQPSPVMARLIMKYAKVTGHQLANASDLDALLDIERRQNQLYQECGRRGYTQEHRDKLLAEDSAASGTPMHKGLGSHPDMLDHIIADGLKHLKEALKKVSAEAVPILVRIGESVLEVLNDAFLTTLEQELQSARKLELGFQPTLLLLTLDFAIETARDEVRQTKLGYAHTVDSAYWGVLTLILERK